MIWMLMGAFRAFTSCLLLTVKNCPNRDVFKATMSKMFYKIPLRGERLVNSHWRLNNYIIRQWSLKAHFPFDTWNSQNVTIIYVVEFARNLSTFTVSPLMDRQKICAEQLSLWVICAAVYNIYIYIFFYDVLKTTPPKKHNCRLSWW